MNKIELVWAWIENTLNRCYEPIYNKQKLKQVVKKLWKDYPLEYHRKSCVSYEDMLWKLLEVEGGHICGRVSPHK